MSNKKNFLPYLICLLIGAVIVIAIVCGFQIWTKVLKDAICLIGDAFFTAGVALAGVGLLVFVSNGGVFDMLAYAVIRLFDLFRKDCKNQKYKDYYEYRQSKKDRNTRMSFMLVVGLFYLLIALVFSLVWANM